MSLRLQVVIILPPLSESLQRLHQQFIRNIHMFQDILYVFTFLLSNNINYSILFSSKVLCCLSINSLLTRV